MLYAVIRGLPLLVKLRYYTLPNASLAITRPPAASQAEIIDTQEGARAGHVTPAVAMVAVTMPGLEDRP